MNEKEFLQKIKEIKVNVPDEQFFLEYNTVVYNILKENQQLKEKLEASEKARKEHESKVYKAKERLIYLQKKYKYVLDDVIFLLEFLDIDKGDEK